MSAREKDGRAYEGVAAAGLWIDGSGRGQTSDFVVGGRGGAESVKDGKRNGAIFLEELRDEYEDKENVDPSDIGVTW